MDEILVKGIDGQWYVLKGDELLAYEEVKPQISATQITQMKELPKGVTSAQHVALEKIQISKSPPPLPTPSLPSIPAVVFHEQHPLRVELEELIAQVMQNVKLKIQNLEWLQDPVLEKRFRMMVSARLREVRDMLETREMLVRAQKVGGLGLTQGLEPVMEIMEQAFKEFQQKWKAREDKQRAARKRLQPEPQEQPEPQKEETELVKVVKPRVLQASVPPPIPPKPAPPPPAPPIPIPPPKPYPLAPRLDRKLTDVRSAPQLIGHLEELASLTVTDFRRLAPTPTEATAKILSKLELLGQESMVRRAQGIEAWRKSPLAGLYGQISHQALSSRRAPEAVLAQAAHEGQLTLTLPEFRAIMELNVKLRF